MKMNETPRGERLHIALFGRRNAGKSSVINAITGQNLSIVSNVRGTTTDPVYKAMEMLPIGPVMLIDTPGLDDEGSLGELRIEKAKEVMRKTDVALLIVDGSEKKDHFVEKELAKELNRRKIPFLWVYNKVDMITEKTEKNVMYISAKNGQGIFELKEKIQTLVPKDQDRPLVRDLLDKGDLVILVVPIDKAAPKSRLILPQQQTIRDILEKGGIPIVVRDTELEHVFGKLQQKPRMVITDSQVFEYVSKVTPKEMPLTSFSILMARYKGNLSMLAKSAFFIRNLQDGDKILMAEGCTHHRQCGDIGTEKLPNWIREFSGKQLIFETSSGNGYPKDLSQYAMIVHCGGCMLNPKEMKYRMNEAYRQKIPIVNYGIMIAYMKGILERSLEIFPEVLNEIGELK